MRLVFFIAFGLLLLTSPLLTSQAIAENESSIKNSTKFFENKQFANCLSRFIVVSCSMACSQDAISSVIAEAMKKCKAAPTKLTPLVAITPNPPIAALSSEKQSSHDGSDTANKDVDTKQRVFLRADKLDNPYPGLTVQAGSQASSFSAGSAIGASLSYTSNDFVQSLVSTKQGPEIKTASSDSLIFSGLASYAFIPSDGNTWIGDIASNHVDFVPTFSLYGNGNWDHPTKTFGDTSVLKIGPDFNFATTPLSVDNQFYNFFGISPYYQSDFYGLARAEGASVSWTPAYQPLYIMSSPFENAKYINGYIEPRMEYTYLNVDIPGQTNLHHGTYDWVGGAVRAYIFPFPNDSKYWPPFIGNRLLFTGTFQNYWDENSGIIARLYTATLQYKLVCTTKNEPPTGSTPNTKEFCNAGSPSLTLRYDYGTDRDTLQEIKKLSLQFTYAF